LVSLLSQCWEMVWGRISVKWVLPSLTVLTSPGRHGD